MGFPGVGSGKESCLPIQESQETLVQSLGQEDPLEEEMAIHSSILAWKIPWTEEPGRVTVHGVAKESDTTEHTACTHTHSCLFHLSQHLLRNFSACGT